MFLLGLDTDQISSEKETLRCERCLFQAASSADQLTVFSANVAWPRRYRFFLDFKHSLSGQFAFALCLFTDMFSLLRRVFRCGSDGTPSRELEDPLRRSTEMDGSSVQVVVDNKSTKQRRKRRRNRNCLVTCIARKAEESGKPFWSILSII